MTCIVNTRDVSSPTIGDAIGQSDAEWRENDVGSCKRMLDPHLLEIQHGSFHLWISQQQHIFLFLCTHLPPLAHDTTKIISIVSAPLLHPPTIEPPSPASPIRVLNVRWYPTSTKLSEIWLINVTARPTSRSRVLLSRTTSLPTLREDIYNPLPNFPSHPPIQQ